RDIAKGTGPDKALLALGYAGWAPGQLENEIRVGAWLPTDFAATLVFDAEREQVWQLAYELSGTTPMAFTTRTVGSA
ncbi:MAG TPA: YqgE/AlgH family protein, partial [Polyangiaceae bacterium]|nr:YqgE/AlgH family protein [Polyangiaceae bacterium]